MSIPVNLSLPVHRDTYCVMREAKLLDVYLNFKMTQLI